MTIFERIIAREIPSTIEYEDSDVIAIRDIAPNAPVHILIIPKKVIPSINELQAEDQVIVGKIFLVARDLARKFGVDEDGYRVVTNVNAHAGQTVFHLHFHLLGGSELGPMTRHINVSGESAPASVAQSPAPSSATATATAIETAATKPLSKLFSKSMAREVAIITVAAIGLAIGFNQMNPKQIPWVKPAFEKTVATDEMLGLSTVPEQPQTPVVEGKTSASDVPETLPEKISEKPNAATGVESTKPEVQSSETKAPAFKAQPGVVMEINMAQFEQLLHRSHYLIDARTPESYSKGHIGSAVNVYGGEVEGRIPELLGMVPTDRVILIYCDGGECELSHHVANALKQFGYGPIYIFTGGWAEWSRKNSSKQ